MHTDTYRHCRLVKRTSALSMTLGKRKGFEEVDGKFVCPASGCLFSASGTEQGQQARFDTPQLAYAHLKGLLDDPQHTGLSKAYRAASARDLEEKHGQQREQATKRQKVYRSRLREQEEQKDAAEQPVIHGICVELASLLGCTSKRGAIDCTRAIVEQGDFPICADSNLNVIHCAKCRLNVSAAAFQPAGAATPRILEHTLRCIFCRQSRDTLIPLHSRPQYLAIQQYFERARDDDLQPWTVEQMDQVKPVMRNMAHRLRSYGPCVDLEQFLSELTDPGADDDEPGRLPDDQAFRAGIMRKFANGEYPQFNFYPVSGGHSALVQLRDSQVDDFKLGQVGWTDKARNSLTLATQTVNVGTPLHVDVTDASNVAMAVRSDKATSTELDPLLVLWALVKPSAIPKVSSTLRAMGKPLETLDKPLTRHQLEQLRKKGVELMLLEQRHGDLINVPPGWLHQVMNLSPNVKLAWDRRVIEHMPAYPRVHALISKHMGSRGAKDYVGFARCCTNAVLGTG